MTTPPFINTLKVFVRISKPKCCCSVQTTSLKQPSWQNELKLHIATSRHPALGGLHRQEDHSSRMVQCQWTWGICRGISQRPSSATTVGSKAILPVIAHFVRLTSLPSNHDPHLLQPSHGVSMSSSYHYYHMKRNSMTSSAPISVFRQLVLMVFLFMWWWW